MSRRSNGSLKRAWTIRAQATTTLPRPWVKTPRSIRCLARTSFYNVRQTTASHNLPLVAHNNSNRLPGPNSYKISEVIGPVRATKIASWIQTPQVNSIPRANNRFKLPSNNISCLIVLESVYNSPGPGYYQSVDCFSHSPGQILKMNGTPALAHENRMIFKR